MKHIPRFYVNLPLNSDADIKLDQDQMHHAHVVLRLDHGDTVRVFNEQYGEWSCHISDIKKNIVTCCEQIKSPTLEKGGKIACALINPSHFSILIEKVTELGVEEIVPVITQYTQYKNFNDKKVKQIVVHACEQSKRLTIPKLNEPIKLCNFLQQNHGTVLVGDESLASGNLLDVISEDVIFLVGPEGGFSEDEYKLFQQYEHVKLFSFGHNILRSETAAISFIAVWNSRFSTK